MFETSLLFFGHFKVSIQGFILNELNEKNLIDYSFVGYLNYL